MQKTTRILTIVLFVQILLVLVLNGYTQGNVSTQAKQQLLDFDRGQVTGILVRGPDKVEVKIEKGKNGWILPAYFKLPADAEKIQQLMTRLHAIKPAWPVANTRESAQRFEVAEDHFQRQLDFLQSGKKVAGLLLGTSPGLRKVHARIPGEKDIYAIDFNTYELPVKQVNWLDKMLLAVKHKPDRIEGKDFVIRRQKDIWLLDKAETSEILDQKKVNQLLGQLENLTVVEVVDAKIAKDKIGAGVELRLQQDNQGQTFTFYQKGEDYLVRSSRYPVYFRMFAATGKVLMNLERKQLLAQAVSPVGVTSKQQK